MMYPIKSLKKVYSEINAPPSKSYTNRALIISALADGKSILRNVLFSDDTVYMINALRDFGIKIISKKDRLIVYGTGGRIKKPKGRIYTGNAGTTMRFITAFSALAKDKVIITGDKRMQERPIQDLLNALNQIGVNAYSKKNNGFPPVVVNGGFLYGGNVSIHGTLSSQFISAIMMIGPLAEKGIKLDVIGELTSKPYADLTIEAMKNFGAEVKNQMYKRFVVSPTGYFPISYFIEGDASNTSYFFASAAITNGRVKVSRINPYSVQGDIRFVDLLGRMGCEVVKGDDYIEVIGNDLNGIAVDMNSMPDTVQTLAIVSLFAKGKTKIFNVKNLRLKETDRIKALVTELRKLGADIKELEDGLIISPKKLHPAIIETYNDHRMAMSFAVAGLMISGIKIKNPDCVKKSFPDFWERFERMYG